MAIKQVNSPSRDKAASSMTMVDDSNGDGNGNGNYSSPSTNIPSSTHSSQAWAQRDKRRHRLRKRGNRAKKMRLLCGMGIIVAALVLVVVHVEVKMLMKATAPENGLEKEAESQRRRMEQGLYANANQNREADTAHKEALKKIEDPMPPPNRNEEATPFPERKHPKKAAEHDNEIGFENHVSSSGAKVVHHDNMKLTPDQAQHLLDFDHQVKEQEAAKRKKKAEKAEEAERNRKEAEAKEEEEAQQKAKDAEIEKLKEEVEAMKKTVDETTNKETEETPEKTADESVAADDKKPEDVVEKKEDDEKAGDSTTKKPEEVVAKKEEEKKADDTSAVEKKHEEAASQEEEPKTNDEPAVPKKEEEGDILPVKESLEEAPALKEAVTAALEKIEKEKKPMLHTANFCGQSSAAVEGVMPALVILGMEDYSTHLFWHVLRELTPEGLITDPGLQPARKVDYEALDNMDPQKAANFFEGLSHKPPLQFGKWIQQSLCGQQRHATVFNKPTVLGFPWLTVNTKVVVGEQGIEALEDLLKLPPGSVYVIRYRRNVLDVVARMEHLYSDQGKPSPEPVELDDALTQVTEWSAQQDQVDKLLDRAKIPHIVIDHEKLFPFQNWGQMLKVTSQVEKFPIPLNVDIDYSNVPSEEWPPESESEREWAKVLGVMKNSKPTTLHDILSHTKTYAQQNVFWSQQVGIKNYAEVKKVLTGTAHERLLRNLEYKARRKVPTDPANEKDTNKEATEEEEEPDLELPDKELEKYPKLKEAVMEAYHRAELMPNPMTANFCGSVDVPDDAPAVMPAVIVLGVEDRSTDLFLHVLREITPSGLISPPVGVQPDTKFDIDSLNTMDVKKTGAFFQMLSFDHSHINGAWVHGSFCLQQQHSMVFNKPNILGFPWLTENTNALNQKHGQEALKDIANMPKGSVMVIRYRRNEFDVATRRKRHLIEEKEKVWPGPVELDPATIVTSLTHWTEQQDAIDDMLEKLKIPHVVINHEKLFPFNHWNGMLKAYKQTHEFPIPINVAIDYSEVPADEKPPETSDLEKEWAKVLALMQNFKPTSMHDILSSAKTFEHHDAFWEQHTAVKNYADIKTAMAGSPFESLLRTLRYKHHTKAPTKAPIKKEPEKEEEPDKEPAKEAEPKKDEAAAKEEVGEDENLKLRQAVSRALEKVEAKPPPKTANFCGETPGQSSGEVMPAVIVLGMEDSSTDLFWHVLEAITPAGLIALSEGLQPASRMEYNVLNDMDPSAGDKFFRKLAYKFPKNDGKWVYESLCLQQQHAKVFSKPTVLGFPWLTLNALTVQGKEGKEALDRIGKLPKGSVTVIRYRRNLLDMMSRQEHHLMKLKEKQGSDSVTLDAKQLLQHLTHKMQGQKDIDDMLETSGIPHVVLDHEKLFPFNNWKDLLNVTNQVEQFQLPLNLDVDYSQIPPDERPPDKSEMELEWVKVLDLMKHTEPVSLYDIFSAAQTYPQKDTFWRQQWAIQNYPKIQQVLTGTHFQPLLRNLEYRHDYFGCACNDKEANKKRILKGWAKNKKNKKKPAADK